MYPGKPAQNKSKVVGSVSALIVIALLAFAAVTSAQQKNDTNVTSQTSATASNGIAAPTLTSDSSTPTTDTTTPPVTASIYKDGTYTASSEYYVPHGYEKIDVTLTIQNGVVKDSTIVNTESDQESAEFQAEFTSAYKSKVIGKNVSEVKLSRVAGASDTTDGFNDALAKIQQQAQA